MPRNQQYQLEDMSGVLFKNLDKDPDNEQHDKWSDYRGRTMVNGVECWLAAWIRSRSTVFIQHLLFIQHLPCTIPYTSRNCRRIFRKLVNFRAQRV
jgi:hypothetical protein